MRRVLLAGLALLNAAQAGAGEIRERLSGNVDFTLSTTKSADELELCLADALSRVSVPAIYHDGKGREVMTGTMTPILKVAFAVELITTPNGTQLVAHTFGSSWNERLKRDLSACL